MFIRLYYNPIGEVAPIIDFRVVSLKHKNKSKCHVARRVEGCRYIRYFILFEF